MTFKDLKESVILTLKTLDLRFNAYDETDRLEFEIFINNKYKVGLFIKKNASRHYYNQCQKGFNQFTRRLLDNRLQGYID